MTVNEEIINEEIIRDPVTHKPVKATWFVVGNSAGVHIYSGYRGSRSIREIHELSNVSGRLQNKALDADAPGRSHESHAMGRHAMEAPTESKQHEQEKFATQIADFLKRAQNNREFGDVKLILPPRLQGLVRDRFPSSLSDRVSGQVNKDISDLANDTLRDRLIDLW